MPLDRPGERDASKDVRGATPADLPEPVSAETRDRATYSAELRAAVAAERWDAAFARFTERWADHERRWPSSPEGQGHNPEADDPSEGDGRSLDSAANAEVDRACDRIRRVEQSVITPAMRDIEAEDPERQLVGLDHRLKGEGRLKEKVANYLWVDPDATPEEAVAMIPDAARFTFCYADDHYTSGVCADLDRLGRRGFELVRSLKNSWESDQYKGINTQWREAETGVRFEVQFHTQFSFDAKQQTHGAYERLRSPGTSDPERQELEELQHEMCAQIPVPADATKIEFYPRKECDG